MIRGVHDCQVWRARLLGRPRDFHPRGMGLTTLRVPAPRGCGEELAGGWIERGLAGLVYEDGSRLHEQGMVMAAGGREVVVEGFPPPAGVGYSPPFRGVRRGPAGPRTCDGMTRCAFVVGGTVRGR